MLDRNVVLVLRTRHERTERRLRHKKEANPPPMEPPAQLLNNNHLYLDLSMNFSENCRQEAARAARKVRMREVFFARADRLIFTRVHSRPLIQHPFVFSMYVDCEPRPQPRVLISNALLSQHARINVTAKRYFLRDSRSETRCIL